MKSTRSKGNETDAGPGTSKSKADHAYAVIRNSVLTGAFSPGDRLVIEQIARDINVSVVPVREAIRRLEAEGYVTYTRNVGATVTSIDLAAYTSTVEAVAILEAAAIGLAAPHITAKDIKEARTLNLAMRRGIKALDPVRFSAMNKQFHELLYSRCPNRHIVNLVIKEWDLLQTTRQSAFSFIPERAIRSVDEHEQLLALIESRRPSHEVEAFAREHRMKTARALLQHFGEEMAKDDLLEVAP